MPKNEQRPYVHVGVFRDANTGQLVGISPVHLNSFQENEAEHTTFRFDNGDSITVEENLYEVLRIFNEGQKYAPPRRRR